MKISEFRRAVTDEFGQAYGRVLTQDTVLAAFDSRTPDEALAAGIPADRVWLALCEANDVPVSRRHGVGLPQPRSR